MAKLIEALLHDHANMQKLLAALERQIRTFDNGGIPDYEIIEAVVQYCLTYPDSCHHPREDAIYHRIATKPQWDGAVHDLLSEHAELATLTREVARTLDAILAGRDMPRDRVMRTMREFLEAYRHHMAMENEFFFPNAEKILDDDDWSAIEAELKEVEDPLFGPTLEKRFAALAQDVLDWDKS